MGRLIKFLIVLILLGFAGLVVYAYVADLSPERHDVQIPVSIPLD